MLSILNTHGLTAIDVQFIENVQFGPRIIVIMVILSWTVEKSPFPFYR
jgi:hypothetical protein